jgi:hypothetical protein
LPYRLLSHFADQVNCTIGKKRVAKAIERSATWFQNFITTSKAAGISFAAPENAAAELKEEAERMFLFGVAQFDKSYPIQLPLLMKHMLSQGAQGKFVHFPLYDMRRARLHLRSPDSVYLPLLTVILY